MQSAANGKDIIFYDGTCGLCHGFVRWAAARDPAGRFLYAPLQGETLRQMVPQAEREKLPDSIVVRPADGRLLLKSDAAKYVVSALKLGGVPGLLRFIPRWLADIGYAVIARMRYRIFGRNDKDVCEMAPPELRPRFLP